MEEIWETTAVGATQYHAFPNGASQAACSNIAPIGGDYLFDEAGVRKLGGTLCDACYHVVAGGNKMAKINITTPEGKAEVEDIEASIERIRVLALAGSDTADLPDEAEGRISELTGKGSVEIRKQLRDLLREATAVQPTSVALAGESYKAFDGVEDLVSKAAEEVSSAVTRLKDVGSQAKVVADLVVSMRLRVIHPKTGLPDLAGRSQMARNAVSDVYAPAKAALTKEDVDGNDAIKALQSSVGNQARNVTVNYLRSLDSLSADEIRTVFGAIELRSGAHTESVYAAYKAAGVELPTTTYNEAQRELMRKRSAALTEGDTVADDATVEELSRVLTKRADITARSVETIVKAAKKQNLSKEEREALKDRLQTLAGKIALEASQL